MDLNQLDIIIKDVAESTQRLEELLGISADYKDETFAQFTIGSHTLMLSQMALVPIAAYQSGLILHIQVSDVDAKCQELQDAGECILNSPTKTDWGTYSVLVQGPEGIVLDFYSVV
ncbi:glyoxalase/bleomycin resistance/extradiol dioxygenase family protein [Streptococcus merionis]|uniref:VOC family protein n=1 Tax=Streptococcus merionis TaxID=400065 RepID=UPI0026ED654C|nr:VOC family protein [Streptococcus merionis]